MLGFVASREEKMPLAQFELGYMLTSAVYTEVFKTKLLPWVKKTTKKLDYIFQQDEVLIRGD